ncbi:hypothetical protein GGE65_003041 [Skermanella aerolata]|uniref:hypothetical protein n=1 Tax=Skermanella aerolata TaxID=393310 RepID=UPI003D1AA472
MTGPGRSWTCAASLGAVAALLLSGQAVLAHNNPQFEETLIQTVAVEAPAAAETASSRPFELSYPPRTAELVWKISGDKADAVRFAVEADGKTVAADVHHGQVTPRVKAGQFRLVDIKGASFPLTVEVFANVIAKK